MILCWKHKKRMTECCDPVTETKIDSYARSFGKFLSREQAYNVLAACLEMPGNVAYSPEGVEKIVTCYILVAEAMMSDSPEERLNVMLALKEAGFDEAN